MLPNRHHGQTFDLCRSGGVGRFMNISNAQCAIAMLLSRHCTNAWQCSTLLGSKPFHFTTIDWIRLLSFVFSFAHSLFRPNRLIYMLKKLHQLLLGTFKLSRFLFVVMLEDEQKNKRHTVDLESGACVPHLLLLVPLPMMMMMMLQTSCSLFFLFLYCLKSKKSSTKSERKTT